MTTLVETLDSRYGQHHARWCIYRAQCGTWVVLLKTEGGHSKSITGATIEEALSNAVDYVPLPEIPRRPTVLDAHQFEPRKSGRYWHLYHGDSFQGVLKSKKDCAKVALKVAKRLTEQAEAWDAQYAKYAALTEGVHFWYRSD